MKPKMTKEKFMTHVKFYAFMAAFAFGVYWQCWGYPNSERGRAESQHELVWENKYRCQHLGPDAKVSDVEFCVELGWIDKSGKVLAEPDERW